MGTITNGGVLDSTNLKDPELQAVEAWLPLKIFKAKRNDKKIVQFPRVGAFAPALALAA